MIQLPIEIGDVIRVGRFKNKRITVKEISVDENGLPTVNGRGILKIRIEKLMPKKEISESIGRQSIKFIGWWQSGNQKSYVESITEDKGSDFKGVIIKFGYLSQYSSRDKSKGWFRINNPRILYPKQGITWEDGLINLDVKLEIKENTMVNEGLVKRNIKEFRERGTKVTVKKEDNEFWLYQLGEDGEEECISNIGYKTEELANHAAFMKGFEVVNSKGTKEKIGFDELPDTRLPPKGTKVEPVKHEEPKYIDLGSEKKINLESLIRRIIKEERQKILGQKKRISEADVTNTDLEAKAKRYAEIANKMKLLEEELKNLGDEFTNLDTEFRPLLEQVGKTKGTFIRAGKLLIKIEREGYDKKSKSYKIGFDYLYSKVNATMKDLADEALKMTETVSYVKSKISVVEEGILNENWFIKIKSFFSSKIKKLFGLNNRANKELDELENKIV